MIFDYQLVSGVFASALGLIGFVPYFRDILRGSTKPHPFSWFVWGLVSGVAFFAQLSGGGGIGAWVTGVGALGCFTVAVLALSRGEKRIVALDWWSFMGALAALVLWQLTDNPLSATILVMLTDALASIPTFHKAYLRPQEETVATYAFGTVGFSFGLLGLRSFNLTTVLFPAYVALANAGLVALLLIRRRQLDKARRI
ncbi:hypothetical protein HY418_00340 [Candidatus Kaiserbacteria bacterium]|nr:hypothetical protein [Candidatus Kaiserbacteria bacterium]